MHKKSQILLELLQIFLSKEMFSWCKHETVVPQFLFHFKGLDTEPTFLRLRGLGVGWGEGRFCQNWVSNPQPFDPEFTILVTSPFICMCCCQFPV